MKALLARLLRGWRPGREISPLWRDIRRRGWTWLYLCDDAQVEYWAYTIGFDETLEHPEIVVCGLPHSMIGDVLGRVFAAVKSGQLVIEEGLEWELCGYGRYVFRKVPRLRITQDRFIAAMYRRWERTGSNRGVAFFQLVTPDDAGLFPWQPGYDEERRSWCPEFWRPPTPRLRRTAAYDT